MAGNSQLTPGAEFSQVTGVILKRRDVGLQIRVFARLGHRFEGWAKGTNSGGVSQEGHRKVGTKRQTFRVSLCNPTCFQGCTPTQTALDDIYRYT